MVIKAFIMADTVAFEGQAKFNKVPKESSARKGLQQFKQGRKLFDDMRDELVRKYPNQWVAVTTNGTIVSGNTVDEVLDAIERKHLDKRNVVMRLMETKRRKMIL